jgi:hypothetical protein
MNNSYLVQILLPKERGDGEPVSQRCFEVFLEELTGRFGGATSFVRAPGQGLWRSGNETERDNIAVAARPLRVLAQPARAARTRAFPRGDRHPRPGNYRAVRF